MRLLISLILLCLSSTICAESVEVENVRIWAAPDSTRVVFDVSQAVKYKVNLLDNPFRVVVDLENTAAPTDFAQPGVGDKFLQRVRGASREQSNLRMVLDLKKFSQIKSFQLQPNKHYGHRLVIDLFNKQLDEHTEQNLELENQPTKNSLRDIVIAVDAGHGGEDPGAKGPSGTYEKTVTLALAKQLVDLINAEHGMKAVLTRKGDYFLRLRKRITEARKYKADLFVSIHADAFRDPRVNGSSVYVLSQRGASSEHARWLAEQENASDLIGGVSLDDKENVLVSVLLDLSQTASLEASIDVADRVLGGLKKVGKVHKKHVEAAAFAVLKSPDIPSILVETAYISNPAEEKKLRSESQRRRMAMAIKDGLKSYFSDYAPEGTLLASRKHIIARGDTLSLIAQQYRVSLNSLRSANRIKGDRIKVGQVLTIPALVN
ncbi:MAG: AMIN domain-containing protein [Gammaproteobacteria bacterium]|nr:AMIN domain-containing protein [Gammaproteobacteria bacterium]